MDKRHLYRILLTGLFTFCFSLITNAYVSTYYTTESKLAKGRWVKIKVSNTGIHEISHEQLLEMGFSNPENVSIYGYGGVLLKNTFDTSLPDDLPAQPVYRADDKICFYAEGGERFDLTGDIYKPSIKRNTYSNSGYYLLSDANPTDSKALSSYYVNSYTTETRENHNSLQIIELEKTCPANGGYRFFGTDFKKQPIQDFTFNVTNADTTKLGQFNYYWAANAPSGFALNIQTNGLEIAYELHRPVSTTYSESSKYYMANNGTMNIKMRNNNNPEYIFTASIPSTLSSYNFAAIDYASFAYYRFNKMGDQAQMRMIFSEVNSNTAFSIKEANENIQVWNVSSPTNVFAYKTNFNSETGILKGSFEKKYSSNSNGHAYLIAFDPTKEQYPVEYVCDVPNQNIHANSAPEMLIITNKSMKQYALQLAEIHNKYQGMKVLVLEQEEIFNEFSSGTPSAIAYRRVAKMFYDRNASTFKYLLFYGAGSYDNRGLIYNNEDLLLTYQCESATEVNDKSLVYCADSYFGMLNDSYNQANIPYTFMDIAVSRIPANRADHAQNINQKVLDYFQNPPTNISQNRALLMCDDGDSNSHLHQTEALADSIIKYAPHTTITKVYNSLYPWTNNDAVAAREAISRALTNGQHYLCYTGHGKPDSFTSEDLWHNRYAKETSYNIYPITFFATCDALSFDRQDSGIAETMLYKATGGSIAVVAASRTVYKDYNQYLSTAFAQQIFDAQKGDCIGDAYRKAHNTATQEAITIGDSFLGINNLCFNLIGDPALPLNITTHKIVTDKINDTAITSNETIVGVHPLANNIISGSVTTSNDIIDTDFNGKITLTLYETPIDKQTLTQGGDALDTITCDEDILLETTIPVVAGKFSAKLNIPIPSRLGNSNRISYYALSNDSKKSAQGYFNQLLINDYDKTQVVIDTTAPEISKLYLDYPSFSDGDCVGNETTLYATILPDESGLCNSSIAIGAATTLMLDNSKSFPEIKGTIVTDIDGVSSIKFPIAGLEDGIHTLTLSVADNAGNRTEKSITFYVINNSVTSALEIAETPARTEATISLTHNFKNEPSGRLIIENNDGETIFTKENCTFPYTWNLQDMNREPVADGIYRCYTILNADKQYSSSSKAKIIVIKQ